MFRPVLPNVLFSPSGTKKGEYEINGKNGRILDEEAVNFFA